MQDDSDGDETFFKRIDFKDAIATNKSLIRRLVRGYFVHTMNVVLGARETKT